MLSSITVLRRDHKRNRNETVGKRMERGGEKNAKRVRKKKERIAEGKFSLYRLINGDR